MANTQAASHEARISTPAVEANTAARMQRGATKAEKPQEQLERLCINTIRTLAMDAVQKANSGHPGAPMGPCGVAVSALAGAAGKITPDAGRLCIRDRSSECKSASGRNSLRRRGANGREKQPVQLKFP
jgi:transketolase-like protein